MEHYLFEVMDKENLMTVIKEKELTPVGDLKRILTNWPDVLEGRTFEVFIDNWDKVIDVRNSLHSFINIPYLLK